MGAELSSVSRVENAQNTDAAAAVAGRALDGLDVAVDLVEDIARFVTRGRPTNVKIRFGERVVAEFPVAHTAAAAIAAGVAAVLLAKLAIEIVHED